MKADALAATFPSTLKFPAEIRALCDWAVTNGDQNISGYFELWEHDDETLRCWFGNDAVVGDLAQFGAGADGSLYCVWRSPDGSQPIVHLGSEGDALYVLAPTALEFFRLLAIGYAEIGFADWESPATDEDEPDNVNAAFQQWVSRTFTVSIPTVGAEIVAFNNRNHAAFQSWVHERCS